MATCAFNSILLTTHSPPCSPLGQVTVWSAPNYCYRCGNSASVLAFDDMRGRDHKLFHCVNEADYNVEERNNIIPYFL